MDMPFSYKFRHLAFYESLKLLASAGMTKFFQCLGLDLADSLSRQVEILSHLLKGMIFLLSNPESHPDDPLFTGSQGG